MNIHAAQHEMQDLQLIRHKCILFQ